MQCIGDGRNVAVARKRVAWYNLRIRMRRSLNLSNRAAAAIATRNGGRVDAAHLAGLRRPGHNIALLAHDFHRLSECNCIHAFFVGGRRMQSVRNSGGAGTGGSEQTRRTEASARCRYDERAYAEQRSHTTSVRILVSTPSKTLEASSLRECSATGKHWFIPPAELGRFRPPLAAVEHVCVVARRLSFTRVDGRTQSERARYNRVSRSPSPFSRTWSARGICNSRAFQAGVVRL